jgi:uncharacterized protein
VTGETDLRKLLSSVQPVLHPETFVFVTLKPGETSPSTVTPIMTFREREGLTLIAPEGEVHAAGLASAFPSRMITLDVNSSLFAIGFLAEIDARLAKAGIAVNIVSAYFHDHLFVPPDHAEEAMAILRSDATRED